MVKAAASADNRDLGAAPSMVQGQIIWYEVEVQSHRKLTTF